MARRLEAYGSILAASPTRRNCNLDFSTANLNVAAAGAVLGWTSPVLPLLEKDGGPLGSPITSEQSSWIGSLVTIGAIAGSFVSGYLGERYIQVVIREQFAT